MRIISVYSILLVVLASIATPAHGMDQVPGFDHSFSGRQGRNPGGDASAASPIGANAFPSSSSSAYSYSGPVVPQQIQTILEQKPLYYLRIDEIQSMSTRQLIQSLHNNGVHKPAWVKEKKDLLQFYLQTVNKCRSDRGLAMIFWTSNQSNPGPNHPVPPYRSAASAPPPPPSAYHAHTSAYPSHHAHPPQPAQPVANQADSSDRPETARGEN